MAEHVHPLTPAEDGFVQLAQQVYREAVQRAQGELSQRMTVFCRQLKTPDGTRFTYEPPVGELVPARLVYDAPDIPAAPDSSDSPPDPSA